MIKALDRTCHLYMGCCPTCCWGHCLKVSPDSESQAEIYVESQLGLQISCRGMGSRMGPSVELPCFLEGHFCPIPPSLPPLIKMCLQLEHVKSRGGDFSGVYSLILWRCQVNNWMPPQCDNAQTSEQADSMGSLQSASADQDHCAVLPSLRNPFLKADWSPRCLGSTPPYVSSCTTSSPLECLPHAH